MGTGAHNLFALQSSNLLTHRWRADRATASARVQAISTRVEQSTIHPFFSCTSLGTLALSQFKS